MTDTPNRNAATTARRPDCVTEVRRGNTVLVICDRQCDPSVYALLQPRQEARLSYPPLF